MSKPPKNEAVVPETQLINRFLSDANHLQRVAITNAEHQLELILKTTFTRLVDQNSKLAEKKKKENLDFSNAVDIACIISRVKLISHLNKMHEQMVQTFHDKAEDQFRLARYAKILSYPDNPVPLQLPRNNEPLESYKERINDEAKKTEEFIQVQLQHIDQRMMDYWGATTWEEGLKIQTHALHEEIAESINNMEFLQLYKQADGSQIDPEDLEPEVSQLAKDTLLEANDEFEEFLLNYVDDTPEIHDDIPEEKPHETTPDAPDFDKTVDLAKWKPVKGLAASQLSFDAQLKLIHDHTRAFHKINVAANVNAMSDEKNNPTRLAIRHAQSLTGKIHALEDKRDTFKKDQHQKKNLNQLSVSIAAEAKQLNEQDLSGSKRPGIK